MLWMSNLVAQYQEKLSSYQNITNQFQNMLSVLLQQQPLHIHSVVGRTKNKQSLVKKIHKADHKYKELENITDLCGLRIITYYEDEVDQIAAFIREHFSTDEDNSVDKREQLEADQFGYASVHVIVNLPIDAAGINPRSGESCKVEIQIRSMLQHAWAEIEHDLEYKNPAGTSTEVRRRFSRLAALLEMADREFKDLRQTLTEGAMPALRPCLNVKNSFKLKQVGAMEKLLLQFSRGGFAAGAGLLMFNGAVLLDLYFNTRISHLALLLSSLMMSV